jgi:hypothetical protein
MADAPTALISEPRNYVTGLENTPRADILPEPFKRPELDTKSEALFDSAMGIFLSNDLRKKHLTRIVNRDDVWTKTGMKLKTGEGENEQQWRFKMDKSMRQIELELITPDKTSTQTLKVTHFPDRMNYPDSEIDFTLINKIKAGDGKMVDVETHFRNDSPAYKEAEKLLQSFEKALQTHPSISSSTPKLPPIS